MPDEGEHELLARLRKGDPSAFHRLVDVYAPRLFGLAHRLTGNRENAEDVVQETLAGAFRSIGGFRGESSLWTWLAKILVRQIARMRRSAGSIRLQRLDVAEGEPEPFGVPTTGPRVAGVDARLDVATAIRRLSPEHRQIVVLREIEQMSYEQIAQVMQMPLGTVESRLYRARVELRRLLADWR